MFYALWDIYIFFCVCVCVSLAHLHILFLHFLECLYYNPLKVQRKTLVWIIQKLTDPYTRDYREEQE